METTITAMPPFDFQSVFARPDAGDLEKIAVAEVQADGSEILMGTVVWNQAYLQREASLPESPTAAQLADAAVRMVEREVGTRDGTYRICVRFLGPKGRPLTRPYFTVTVMRMGDDDTPTIRVPVAASSGVTMSDKLLERSFPAHDALFAANQQFVQMLVQGYGMQGQIIQDLRAQIRHLMEQATAARDREFKLMEMVMTTPRQLLSGDDGKIAELGREMWGDIAPMLGMARAGGAMSAKARQLLTNIMLDPVVMEALNDDANLSTVNTMITGLRMAAATKGTP